MTIYIRFESTGGFSLGTIKPKRECQTEKYFQRTNITLFFFKKAYLWKNLYGNNCLFGNNFQYKLVSYRHQLIDRFADCLVRLFTEWCVRTDFHYSCCN